MKKITQIVNSFQNQLQKQGNKENQKIFSKYFKHQVDFRGVKTPQLNEIFKEIWTENKKNLDLKQKKLIAFELIKSKYSEDKQIGILILKDLTTSIENKDIDDIQNLIKKGYLNNWGNIDSLCGKLLQDWTKISKENTLYISKWSEEDDYLWVRRASCVTFVNRAKHPDSKKPNFKGFGEIMFQICLNTVSHEERFNQLGCGWLLRNLTISHKNKALTFLEEHYDEFSREGLRYAIEKLDDKERKYYLNFKKNKENNQSQSQKLQDEDEEENISSDEEEIQKQKKPKKSQKQPKKLQKKN